MMRRRRYCLPSRHLDAHGVNPVADWRQAQTHKSPHTCTHSPQLSQRIASLTGELDDMTNLNTKLREQGASIDAENARQMALVKELASRDMQVMCMCACELMHDRIQRTSSEF